MNNPTRQAARPRVRRKTAAIASAFTLLEMLVSIALVLILVLGVNAVFRIATDSVGAGQGLSEVTRSDRAVQTVLYNDIAQSVIRSSDAPCFIIRSTRTAAFLDQEDALSDRDYVPTATRAATDLAIRTIDLDGDNLEGEPPATSGETIPRNQIGQRNFRQDVMVFFARHLFPRQTGDDGVYAAQMSSNEAFIWYGHLRQPADLNNTATSNVDPGPADSGTPVNAQTNPNNFYARQWAIGRVAVLLREPTGVVINDNYGDPQEYIARIPNPSEVPNSSADPSYNYTPLGQDSQATDGALIQYSRYDLAATTIDQFRTRLRNDIIPNYPPPAPRPHWFSPGGLAYRFTGYPFPVKPHNSYGVARTVPWLVGGATSFMVEYAGDFLQQDPATGAVTDSYQSGPAGVDGRTDFTVNADGTQGVRWYGFPRDINGNGTFTLPENDVLPLRDSLAAAGDPPAPFEHFDTGGLANYVTPALDAFYTCAWQPVGTYGAAPEPPKPTMLRVTMIIDDSAGRLPNGQTVEYVIEIP